MANLNNIRIPLIVPKSIPDPTKVPDVEDPNNYCEPLPLKGLNTLRSAEPTIDILNLYCYTCNKVYDTKMCDKKFSTNTAFKAHLQKIHKMGPPRHNGLMPDMNDRNNYCVACDKKFSRKDTFLEHLISVHLDKMPQLYQGTDCINPGKRERNKKYCGDCQKIFPSRHLFLIHMDKIHGIKSLEPMPNVDDTDVNSTNRHCTRCNRTYCNRVNYRVHMASVHNLVLYNIRTNRLTISNTVPVVDYLTNYCNVCDRTYNRFRSYRCHLSKYHQIKTVSEGKLSNIVNRNGIPVIDEINQHCTACDRVYKHRSNYKAHMQTIHGILIPRIKIPNTNHNITPV
ncbi:hypothetical protein BDF21DRAFT_401905 [Thamnidium elegans]|nr:hypothetical protein BDF21DRAFT_401905 [Thamnidium elegans]